MKSLPILLALTVGFLAVDAHAQQKPHPAVVAGVEFWKQLADVEQAYQETSARYQRSNSLDDFRAQIEESKANVMTDYKFGKATGSDDGKNALIVGSGKNEESKSVLARIQVEEEDGTFRMFTFTVQPKGVKPPPPIKDVGISLDLARSTLTHIAGAIEKGDIASVYNRIPMEDRQQNSLASYKGVLTKLNQSRYGPIEDLVDRIVVKREGVMQDKSATYFLSADFPEKRRRLSLEFRSLWADVKNEPWLINWRSSYVNPDSPTEPPTEAECLALARTALETLFAGFAKGSLEDFYEKAAPLFRENFTLERVKNAYPAFTSGKVPFETWKLDQLQLLSHAMAGADGPTLSMQVEIPTAAQPAYAALTFLHETSEWGYIGVSFHSKNPTEK